MLSSKVTPTTFPQQLIESFNKHTETSYIKLSSAFLNSINTLFNAFSNALFGILLSFIETLILRLWKKIKLKLCLVNIGHQLHLSSPPYH